MEDYETQAGKEDRQDEINSMDKQRPPQGGEDQAVPLPELVFLGLVLGGYGIMKAKQCAERYVNDPTSETLASIAEDFVLETKRLVEQRKIQGDAGFLSLLREMDDKWSAFARRTSGAVKLNGYRILMLSLYPDAVASVWPLEQKERLSGAVG